MCLIVLWTPQKLIYSSVSPQKVIYHRHQVLCDLSKSWVLKLFSVHTKVCLCSPHEPGLPNPFYTGLKCYNHLPWVPQKVHCQMSGLYLIFPRNTVKRVNASKENKKKRPRSIGWQVVCWHLCCWQIQCSKSCSQEEGTSRNMSWQLKQCHTRKAPPVPACLYHQPPGMTVSQHNGSRINKLRDQELARDMLHIMCFSRRDGRY